MVRRFDSGTLRLDSKRTPQGFIRADAIIARTGVQAYRRSDGGIQNEYRPPEAVFHPDALASFSLAPLTLNHPPVPVTAANAREYMVGTTGEIVARRDSKYVATTVLITDADAIRSVERGDTVELSCGYQCDLDFTPGTTPDGERYDAVQIAIRGNHVALVPQARAGPEARLTLDHADPIGPLKLDANDAVQVSVYGDRPPLFQYGGGGIMADKKMKIAIKIDGMDYAVKPSVAQAIERMQKLHNDALASLRSQLEAAKTETVAARGDTDKAKKDATEQKTRADASDLAVKTSEATANARASERFALEAQSRKVLGVEVKLDKKTDDEVRRLVVAKLSPEIKLDGKDATYVLARYDVAIEDAEKKGKNRNPAGDARFGAVGDPNHADAGVEDKQDGSVEKKAREDFKTKARDAWKTGEAKA